MKLHLKSNLILSLIVAIGFISNLNAQSTNKDKETKEKSAVSMAKKDDRPSPPQVANGEINDLKVTINYGSPAVKGRKIWGDLVPYDKIWRSGANEATTIEVSRDTKVGGKALKAGKYSLFTIPGEKEWTIIFNSIPEQWGSYKYDEAKDALRITAAPEKSTKFNERLIYSISTENGNGKVSLAWENLVVNWEMR
jgi:hypothetical protein